MVGVVTEITTYTISAQLLGQNSTLQLQICITYLWH